MLIIWSTCTHLFVVLHGFELLDGCLFRLVGSAVVAVLGVGESLVGATPEQPGRGRELFSYL